MNRQEALASEVRGKGPAGYSVTGVLLDRPDDSAPGLLIDADTYDAELVVYGDEHVADMTIPETEAWIGTSLARAAVVADQEQARGDDARKGIAELTGAILGDAQPGQ